MLWPPPLSPPSMSRTAWKTPSCSEVIRTRSIEWPRSVRTFLRRSWVSGRGGTTPAGRRRSRQPQQHPPRWAGSGSRRARGAGRWAGSSASRLGPRGRPMASLLHRTSSGSSQTTLDQGGVEPAGTAAPPGPGRLPVPRPAACSSPAPRGPPRGPRPSGTAAGAAPRSRMPRGRRPRAPPGASVAEKCPSASLLSTPKPSSEAMTSGSSPVASARLVAREPHDPLAPQARPHQGRQGRTRAAADGAGHHCRPPARDHGRSRPETHG